MSSRNKLTISTSLGRYDPNEKRFAYTPEQQAFIDSMHERPWSERTPEEMERYRLLMMGFWQPEYPKW